MKQTFALKKYQIVCFFFGKIKNYRKIQAVNMPSLLNAAACGLYLTNLLT